MRACEPRSLRDLCGALFYPGCLWQLLATWMGPWPSMTCLRRPSGTSVSTRYRQPQATAMTVWKPQPLGASALDLASVWSFSMACPPLPSPPLSSLSSPSLPSLPSLLPLLPSMRVGSRCLSSPAPDLRSACCILVQSGIVQLLWEAGTAVVYTCSLDGIVRLWDARTGRLLTDYRGHTAEILDFALSK